MFNVLTFSIDPVKGKLDFRTGGCLVTVYYWWWVVTKASGRMNSSRQARTWSDMNGNPFMGSRGECTSDTGKEILRRGQGHKYSSSPIMTLSTHMPDNNRSHETPIPPKSSLETWNLQVSKFRTFVFNYYLIFQAMIHYICTVHTNTRRQEQAPAQHLIKLPQIVGEAMSREGFPGICNKTKQNNLAKQGCGVQATN